MNNPFLEWRKYLRKVLLPENLVFKGLRPFGWADEHQTRYKLPEGWDGRTIDARDVVHLAWAVSRLPPHKYEEFIAGVEEFREQYEWDEFKGLQDYKNPWPRYHDLRICVASQASNFDRTFCDKPRTEVEYILNEGSGVLKEARSYGEINGVLQWHLPWDSRVKGPDRLCSTCMNAHQTPEKKSSFDELDGIFDGDIFDKEDET